VTESLKAGSWQEWPVSVDTSSSIADRISEDCSAGTESGGRDFGRAGIWLLVSQTRQGLALLADSRGLMGFTGLPSRLSAFRRIRSNLAMDAPSDLRF